jgi:hypothetical protein
MTPRDKLREQLPAHRASTLTEQRSAPPYIALMVRPSIALVVNPIASEA